MRRGRAAGGALAALAVLLATACPRDGAPEPVAPPSAPLTAAAPSDQRSGGTFYYAVTEPRSLDPAHAADVEDFAVVSQVFDSLTAVDERLAVVPAAAERWESNEDFTEFTFHLVPGATFHNDEREPVTAESFKRAWQRIVDQTQPGASIAHYHLASIVGYGETRDAGTDLAGVEVVDDLTLRVRLSAPLSVFPAIVSYPALAPVPRDALASPEEFAREPVGNGPFVVAEPWEGSQAIRVRRFDDYYGRPPLLDEIVFRVYGGDTSVATAYRELLDGRLHFAPVPPQRLADAARRYGRSDDGYAGPGLLDGSILVTYFYGFNTRVPPFDDPEVRRALSLLIDREAIARDILSEARLPATGIVPDGIAGYRPAPCDFCQYDPPRAKRLLSEKALEPFELWLYEEGGHEEVANRVKREIDRALGPDSVRLRVIDGDRYVNALTEGIDGAQGGFFLGGWFADYPTADNFLHPLFHTSTVGVENLSRFSDPEVDALLDQARLEGAEPQRASLYRQAEARVLDAMPIAPIMVYRHTRVVAPEVRGFTYTALKTVDMTRVWLEDPV